MIINDFHLRMLEHWLASALQFRQPADVALSSFFRLNKKLGGRERHIIAESGFSVLRHLRHFQALAPHATQRQYALLGMARAFGLNKVAPILDTSERAWLEHTISQKVNSCEFPDWVVQQLSFDATRLRQLDAACSRAAPLDVRVNSLKGKRADVLRQLPEDWQAQATPFSPWGVRLPGKPALHKHPLFLNGTIEVQDESSQLAALLVGARRGEMVLDFCAGAGGKTLAMGAMMHSKGRLYAWDLAEHRLEALRQRIKRSELSNVQVERIRDEHDSRIKRLHGKLDRVLVDAPCSGFGTLRRNPDLKFRQNEASLKELQAKQRSILHAAAALPKVGGRLVYATCSLLPCENQDIIQEFLAEHSDYQLLPASAVLAQAGIALNTGDYLSLYPDLHQTDGFFACVLQRG